MPYEHDDNTHMQISIEMDLNRMHYSRARYTVLDALAQFGGFIGIFGKIFGFFMAAWNFNALSNYMVTRLYKTSEDAEKSGEGEQPFHRSNFPHCGDYLLSWVPSPLVCCKKDAKEKAKVKARQSLSNEMDMVQEIQQKRFIVAALDTLLTKTQIAQLRKQTRFKTVELQPSGVPEDASSDVKKITPSEKESNIEQKQ